MRILIIWRTNLVTTRDSVSKSSNFFCFWRRRSASGRRNETRDAAEDALQPKSLGEHAQPPADPADPADADAEPADELTGWISGTVR